VKTLLPPDRMDDIAEEVRSNLQSLVEDRAVQMGRDSIFSSKDEPELRKEGR
jgi:hypothetical protein